MHTPALAQVNMMTCNWELLKQRCLICQENASGSKWIIFSSQNMIIHCIELGGSIMNILKDENL